MSPFSDSLPLQNCQQKGTRPTAGEQTGRSARSSTELLPSHLQPGHNRPLPPGIPETSVACSLFSCNHPFSLVHTPPFRNKVTKKEKKKNVYKHPGFHGSKVISSSMKACRQLALKHNQEAVVERRRLRRNFLDNV